MSREGMLEQMTKDMEKVVWSTISKYKVIFHHVDDDTIEAFEKDLHDAIEAEFSKEP